MENVIYLSEIFTQLQPLSEYKIHFAKYSGTEPLDAYIRDFNEWEAWNTVGQTEKMILTGNIYFLL